MLNHYKSVIAGSMLLILPFVFEAGAADEIRVPKLKALILFAGIYFSAIIYRRIRPSLGLAFGAAVLSAVFSGLGPQHQLVSLASLAAAIGTSFLVANSNDFEIKRILGFLVLGGLGSSVMAYLQMAGHDPLFFYPPNVDKTLPCAFLGQQTLFGPFVASCIVAALFRKNYFCALFMIPPCLAVQGSFTDAALACGVTIWIGYQFGFKYSALLIFLGLGGVVWLRLFHQHNELLNDGGRYENWAYIWKEAWNRPIFGHGFGTFAAYSDRLQPPDLRGRFGFYRQAHNDYLELFFDMGLVGVGLALAVLGDACRNLMENIHRRYVVASFAVASVYFIDALGSFPFRLVPQSLIALWCIVMVVKYKNGSYTRTIYR